MSLHLMVRWQARYNPQTVEAHRDVAEKAGAAWFGLLGGQGSATVALSKLADLYEQIATGVPTHIYLVGVTGLWRADLVYVTPDENEVDYSLVPSYYDPAWAPELWLKLANFIQMGATEGWARDWIAGHLRLADSGQSPDFTSGTTVIAVREIDEVAMPMASDFAKRTAAIERMRVPVSFTTESLAQACAARNLRMERSVLSALVAALTSGKHVILTGPPGTGKTTLAETTAELAKKAGLCTGHTLTTATADWTTYETIGGLTPDQNDGSLTFRPGHFLNAARDDLWLIVDELNRSNFDRAFGQLFTVLSGQSVVLPYTDPRGRSYAINAPNSTSPYDAQVHHVLDISTNWRIVATMNVFDKSLLFEMSFALMRRFAFIEVPSPSDAVIRELWLGELDELSALQYEAVDAALLGLSKLRQIKDLGPAVFLDMARFAAKQVEDTAELDRSAIYFQLFYSFLLPQFEGIDRDTGERLYKLLRANVGAERHERVRSILYDVLGLTVTGSTGLTDFDSDDGSTEGVGR